MAVDSTTSSTPSSRPALTLAVSLAVAMAGGSFARAQPASSAPAGADAASSNPSTPGNPATPSPVTRVVTAIPGEKPDSLSLIGPSGQIYRHDGAGTWKRHGLGGVATDVDGAIRTPSGAIFVTGSDAPIYRLDGQRDRATWHVHRLPNRGPAHAPGPDSEPVLSIGRHIYTWKATGWTRLTGTRSRITALWGHAQRRQQTVTAATESGKVLRITASSQKVLRNAPGPSDPVVMFFGRHNLTLFAATRGGALLEVRARALRPVTLAPSARGLSVHTGMVDRDGILWVAGAAPRVATPGAPPGDPPVTELVLARLDPAPDPPSNRPRDRSQRRPRNRSTDSLRVSLVQRFADLDPGDRVTVIRELPDRMIVVVTKNGAIRMRSGDGTWHNGKLIDRVAVPASRPATSGPARAR